MYEPFRGFEYWSSVVVDEARWQRVVDHANELRGDRGDFDWLNGPLRASAYQSGAIEGMHAGDRGLTVTLMNSVVDWEVAVRESADGGGADVVDHIRAGVDALHLALDAGTQATPISEAWIREVHDVALAAQETYSVNTAAGERQEHVLPKGTYKGHDNHVRLVDGSLLEFAPTQDVRPEMERLTRDLQSDEFAEAHPVAQAAFAHQALTHIHPFADGNGRVARVVASVYLLRSLSLPLFLFSDQKERYLDALNSADRGEPQVWVDFVLARVEDLSGLLVEERRMRSGEARPWRDELEAAERFTTAVRSAIFAAQRRHRISPSRPIVREPDEDDPNVTWLERGDIPRLETTSWSIPLAEGFEDVSEIVATRFQFNESTSYPLIVSSSPSDLRLEARVDEVWPTISTAFELRLATWIDRVLAASAERISRILSDDQL